MYISSFLQVLPLYSVLPSVPSVLYCTHYTYILECALERRSASGKGGFSLVEKSQKCARCLNEVVNMFHYCLKEASLTKG